MANATLPARSPITTHELAPVAGVLSYLVPGLGQIVQGRVGKGLLFLVCIYTLFFYGLYLGTGTVTLDGQTYRVSGNVYLPDTTEDGPRDRQMPILAQNLYNRPQFAGQFWVGIAAWPAIVQYLHFDRNLDRQISDLEHQVRTLEADGPEAEAEAVRKQLEQKKAMKDRHPVLGDFQREPSPAATNALHNAGDKRMELAWVYTVIAGVLNILVIYDAVAGPAFALASQQAEKKD